MLSACGLIYDNDHELADEKMEEILHAIQSGNKENVKALFAPAITADLDKGFEEFQKYYRGNYQALERVGGPGTSESADHGRVRKTMHTSYLLTTDIEQYCISFKWCCRDDFDKQNIGVRSIYIIRSTDCPHFQEYVYWGDGSGAEGIFVNKPYASYYVEKLIECIQESNKERFISMFVNSAIESQSDFNKNVDTLFSIYDGKYDYGNCIVDAFSTDSNKGYDISYYLLQNESPITKIDCICLRWCMESDDPSNLGAISFYYKKAEPNISMQDPFWGDGFWTSGIHILDLYNSKID